MDYTMTIFIIFALGLVVVVISFLSIITTETSLKNLPALIIGIIVSSVCAFLLYLDKDNNEELIEQNIALTLNSSTEEIIIEDIDDQSFAQHTGKYNLLRVYFNDEVYIFKISDTEVISHSRIKQ